MQRISQYLNRCVANAHKGCEGWHAGQDCSNGQGQTCVRWVWCVWCHTAVQTTFRQYMTCTLFGGGGVCKREEGAHAFFSCRSLCSSSASSAVLTRISIGTGVLGFLSATGGFGTHTTMTLFFPVRVQGMEEWTMIFNRMLPRETDNSY